MVSNAIPGLISASQSDSSTLQVQVSSKCYQYLLQRSVPSYPSGCEAAPPKAGTILAVPQLWGKVNALPRLASDVQIAPKATDDIGLRDDV